MDSKPSIIMKWPTICATRLTIKTTGLTISHLAKGLVNRYITSGESIYSYFI